MPAGALPPAATLGGVGPPGPPPTPLAPGGVRSAGTPAAAKGFHALLRVRPTEGDSPTLTAWSSMTVEFSPTGQVFAFDAVLGPEAGQADVFERVRPLVSAALTEGGPATLLTYGQTGAGKTHTLIGGEGDEGVLPRAAAMLCAAQRATPGTRVVLSASEIYCDRVRDLLRPEHDGPHPAAGREGGASSEASTTPAAAGDLARASTASAEATGVVLGDEASCAAAVRAAVARRAVAATGMNSSSSRGHCVFRFDVLTPQERGDRRSSITLVDLAGSERASRSGATGQTMTEASAINLSLSALGNVVASLTADKPRGHVPYRSSKLTRLLQPSLSGTGRTALLLCVSAARDDGQETLGTLRFGARAMGLPLAAPLPQTRSETSDRPGLTSKARASPSSGSGEATPRGRVGGGEAGGVPGGAKGGGPAERPSERESRRGAEPNGEAPPTPAPAGTRGRPRRGAPAASRWAGVAQLVGVALYVATQATSR